MKDIKKVQDTNPSSEAAALFIYLGAGAALVVSLTIALCAWQSWGSTIAVSLTATNVGILIAVVMLKAKLSECSVQVFTAAGILLTASGYFYSLAGAFQPVAEISLETSQMFTLKGDAASCKFSPAISKLSCSVAIEPK